MFININHLNGAINSYDSFRNDEVALKNGFVYLGGRSAETVAELMCSLMRTCDDEHRTVYEKRLACFQLANLVMESFQNTMMVNLARVKGPLVNKGKPYGPKYCPLLVTHIHDKIRYFNGESSSRAHSAEFRALFDSLGDDALVSDTFSQHLYEKIHKLLQSGLLSHDNPNYFKFLMHWVKDAPEDVVETARYICYWKR